MALESGRDWIDRSRGALLGQRARLLTSAWCRHFGAIFGLSVLKYLSNINGVRIVYLFIAETVKAKRNKSFHRLDVYFSMKIIL